MKVTESSIDSIAWSYIQWHIIVVAFTLLFSLDLKGRFYAMLAVLYITDILRRYFGIYLPYINYVVQNIKRFYAKLLSRINFRKVLT